jgi:hypothetical protein
LLFTKRKNELELPKHRLLKVLSSWGDFLAWDPEVVRWSSSVVTRKLPFLFI